MVYNPQKLGILRHFYKEPSKGLYIRELEKIGELSYERVHHYLKELEGDSILVSMPRGKIKEYRINEDSELLEKVFGYFEFEKREEFFRSNKNIEKTVMDLKEKLIHSVGDPIKYILIKPPNKRGEIEVLIVAHKVETPFYNRVVDICKKYGTEKVTFLVYLDTISDFRSKLVSDPDYKESWKDSLILFGEENFWGEMLRRGLYKL